MEKFSKPFASLRTLKADFFENNRANLEKVRKINAVYRSQDKRQACKVCDARIGSADIVNSGIEYSICEVCGHLNGLYADTKEFEQAIYVEHSDGYAINYLQGDYNKRVAAIYEPKVDFLLDVLSEFPVNPITISDFGCGGGYFVKAAQNKGIAATGYDVSPVLIEAGNKMTADSLVLVDSENIYQAVTDTDSTVVSAIGVMEHLSEPNRFLQCFVTSRATFLYLSLPLFSLSVFLENSFPSVFPRQLSGGHTHLYTKESVEFFTRQFGLEVLGSWWFGTDAMDLLRSLLVQGQINGSSEKALHLLDEKLGGILDDLQSELDRAYFCSEVHVVLGKGQEPRQ